MLELEKCKVVILSTNERVICKGDIDLFDSKLSIRERDVTNMDSNNPVTRAASKKQHLYILSDDEIKEGDWCIEDLISTIKHLHKCKSIEERDGAKIYLNRYGTGSIYWKKVIASTNPSLGLPRLSKSFIEKYIEKYNKDNQIKEINVVYEPYGAIRAEIKGLPKDDSEWCYPEWAKRPIVGCKGYRPKVNRDDTISIKRLKTSWNREEVEKLILDAVEEGAYFEKEWKQGMSYYTLEMEKRAKNFIKKRL